VTEEGKRKSRRNAVRHGLTAETVICPLEDADDYAAFELAVTADYDAQSAVERELVLRLASLLWRLRRSTAIESGLFRIQVQHLIQFRRGRQTFQKLCSLSLAPEVNERQHEDERLARLDDARPVHTEPVDRPDDLTRSFVRLSNLPTYPLDRLSRYEATLWRQTYQILVTLRCLSRRSS